MTDGGRCALLICKEVRRCTFVASYGLQDGFRQNHFNYFCFGPLAEYCARRKYSRQHGHMPQVDYSPLGTSFGVVNSRE